MNPPRALDTCGRTQHDELMRCVTPRAAVYGLSHTQAQTDTYTRAHLQRKITQRVPVGTRTTHRVRQRTRACLQCGDDRSETEILHVDRRTVRRALTNETTSTMRSHAPLQEPTVRRQWLRPYHRKMGPAARRDGNYWAEATCLCNGDAKQIKSRERAVKARKRIVTRTCSGKPLHNDRSRQRTNLQSDTSRTHYTRTTHAQQAQQAHRATDQPPRTQLGELRLGTGERHLLWRVQQHVVPGQRQVDGDCAAGGRAQRRRQ